VVAVWRLIQGTALVAWAMHVVAALFLGWFAWFIARCDRVQRQQMIALLVLILGVLVFFTLYEQTYGSWLMFTDRLMTKDMFPSLVSDASGTLPWSIWLMAASPVLIVMALRASDAGRAGVARTLVAIWVAAMATACFRDVVLVPQTAGSLTFLGSFFILVLTPLFAWLWPWLDRRGWNPPKPLKSAIGLLFAGLAFLPMIAAANAAGNGAMASVWWLVLAYFIFEIGEMCLSPIGLSAVTQLSVARVVGLMMGGFWLATAYSEVLAAQLGKLASVDIPEGGVIDMAAERARLAGRHRIDFVAPRVERAQRERAEREGVPAAAGVPAALVDRDRHAVRAGCEVDRAEVGEEARPVQLHAPRADLAAVDRDGREAVPVPGEPRRVGACAGDLRVDAERARERGSGDRDGGRRDRVEQRAAARLASQPQDR